MDPRAANSTQLISILQEKIKDPAPMRSTVGYIPAKTVIIGNLSLPQLGAFRLNLEFTR